jgi:DNA-binding NarL/FixJ family response regulator
MDLTIPGGVGGREAVQEIHKIDPAAKVIVSSGYSNDPIMADYLDYGFCAAIVKPFKLQEFHEVISRVLG